MIGKRSPKRQPGDCYTKDSYARAIARGCQMAGVPHWHPHQLRHSAAANIRKQFGLEAARCMLGHKMAAVTEMYASEFDEGKARDIMARIG